MKGHFRSPHMNFPDAFKGSCNQCDTHKGCYFHFTQAIWRHAQAFDLSIQYKEHDSVRSLVRRTMALTFLTVVYIRPELIMDNQHLYVELTTTYYFSAAQFVYVYLYIYISINLSIYLLGADGKNFAFILPQRNASSSKLPLDELSQMKFIYGRTSFTLHVTSSPCQDTQHGRNGHGQRQIILHFLSAKEICLE